MSHAYVIHKATFLKGEGSNTLLNACIDVVKYILCWAFFLMVSMLDAPFRSWEIVDFRNLKVSTADTVFSVMMGVVAVLWGSS